MSLYSLKQAGGRAMQPWSQRMSVVPSGNSLAQLYSMYNGRPETNITGALTLPSLLDGPIQVYAFGDTTLNGATITLNNRCRGAILLFKSLTCVTAASTIHMQGKGAMEAGAWPLYDLTFPVSVDLQSSALSFRQISAMIRENGWFPGDPVLWSDLKSLVTATINPGATILQATSCGSGGGPVIIKADSSAGGSVGAAATKGTGGGAGGGWYGYDGSGGWISAGGRGEKGKPWRGGIGGRAGGYGGVGDGGSPSAVPTATPPGIVIVGVLGNVVCGPGLIIQANADNNAANTRDGGQGGGLAKLIYGGTLTGTPTIQANGATPSGGSAGGAGTADSSTFAALAL